MVSHLSPDFGLSVKSCTPHLEISTCVRCPSAHRRANREPGGNPIEPESKGLLGQETDILHPSPSPHIREGFAGPPHRASHHHITTRALFLATPSILLPTGLRKVYSPSGFLPSVTARRDLRCSFASCHKDFVCLSLRQQASIPDGKGLQRQYRVPDTTQDRPWPSLLSGRC